MAEVGATARDTEDVGLAGQIDALLSGMSDSAASLAADQKSEAIEQSLAAASASPGSEPPTVPSEGQEALSPDEVRALASQLDALVDEVEATTGVVGAGDAAADSGPSELSPDSTAEAEADPERMSPSDIAELDTKLAAMAIAATEEAPSAPASPAAVLPAVDGPVGAREPETASLSTSPVLLPGVGGGDWDALREGAPSPAARPARVPLMSRVRALVARATPAARWLMDLSGRTLEAAPKLARDTAGWIGLVTVFFACCMWAIILFFRSTPVPETFDVPSVVLEPGDATPQPRPRPRPAAPAAAADHGKPADTHAAPADAGHGGGGGH